MEGHPQGRPGPQAAPGPDRAGHRARRHVHLRHLHPHRHPAQHLQQRCSATSTRTSTSRSAGWPGLHRRTPGPSETRSPSRCWPRPRRCPVWRQPTGTVTGFAQFVAHDGKAMATGGAPTIGMSLRPGPAALRPAPAPGPAPDCPHDVVMDAGTAQKYHFHVGEQVRILLAGPPQTFTITGIAQFGTANNLAGATLAAFTLPTAQHCSQGRPGTTPSTSWPHPGRTRPPVQRAIARSLPPGVEVVTGQTVVDEQTTTISKALGVLLDRAAHLRLHRAVRRRRSPSSTPSRSSSASGPGSWPCCGSSGPAAARSSARCWPRRPSSGCVASLVGLGLGVLAAVGLEALLKRLRHHPAVGRARVRVATVLVALVVGVGVTVVSAISPARRAVRIPPVAALADQAPRRPVVRAPRWCGARSCSWAAGPARRRADRPAIQLVGLGAVGIFLGVAMLAPLSPARCRA